MSGAEILIVDDETSVRQALSSYLAQRGYRTESVASGEQALDWLASRRPDLILLDLVMPGIGGIQSCRRIREMSAVPIVVLSVLSDEQEKVEALRAGADDYVTKPFGPEELIARIEVGLRHGRAGTEEEVLTCGDLTIELRRRRVLVGAREVRLTPTEYGLLRCLAVHAGQIVTYDLLLQTVWGSEAASDIQPIRYGMHQLRRKLGDDPRHPRYIFTELGVGYWLETDPL